MRIISAADIGNVLTFTDLVETLRSAFRTGAVTPLRHHHEIEFPDQSDATLLLMPAWTDFERQGHSEKGYLGVKIVSVFPDNADRGLASVTGVYVLLSGHTGAPLALIDGQALTLWRTAAASALAASYLARNDAKRLLMVGAGSLAPYLIDAHAAVRGISDVLIWNRRPEKAARLAKSLKGKPYNVATTDDLASAAGGADIISCATMSSDPVLSGDWLPRGVHVDLVGGFKPSMREVDDEAIRRSRIFVDTREGALKEAGDIIQPIESGLLNPDDIAGDLFDLTQGDRAGRRYHDQVTLFKSVGTALEDLAAASHVFARA